VSRPLFGVTILTFSILFTWVYTRTGGSLLMAILFHTGINTPSFLSSAAAPALDADPLYQHVTLGLLAAIALAVVVATRGHLGLRDRSAGVA
jgi:membrane protease YdiL (CAAX protease family)